MAFFLYFALVGIALYLLNALWLKIRDHLSLTAYLLSGTISGIIFGLLVKFIYQLQGISWFIVPIVSISAALFLFIFAKYDLYQNPFFQLFGTITLGVSTGLLSLLIVTLLENIVSSQMFFLNQSKSLILDMIIYGFLLNFGYAFSGRIFRKKRPKRQAD